MLLLLHTLNAQLHSRTSSAKLEWISGKLNLNNFSERHHKDISEVPALGSPLIVTTVQAADGFLESKSQCAHHSRSRNPPRLLLQAKDSMLERLFECWTALRLCRVSRSRCDESLRGFV